MYIQNQIILSRLISANHSIIYFSYEESGAQARLSFQIIAANEAKPEQSKNSSTNLFFPEHATLNCLIEIRKEKNQP